MNGLPRPISPRSRRRPRSWPSWRPAGSPSGRRARRPRTRSRRRQGLQPRGSRRRWWSATTWPDVDRRLGPLRARERSSGPTDPGPEGAEAPASSTSSSATPPTPGCRRLSASSFTSASQTGWRGRTGRATPVGEVDRTHLEQAYRYRTELGPLDDRAQAVGRMAAGFLGNLGRRVSSAEEAGCRTGPALPGRRSPAIKRPGASPRPRRAHRCVS